MLSAGSTAPENGSRLRVAGIWGAPLVVLFGVWLWLAFSSGGFVPHQWLLPSLALGLFGLVVSLLVAYPRRPRQLSLALLALLACYSLWVALSALWADSTNRVWLESGRTFAYVLVFALAVMYLTDQRARRVFRYLVMTAAFVLIVACVWKLWATDNLAGLFIENRLSYPVSYPNNAAALFLVAFWPLLWLAVGSEERAPIRGIALGLATGLLGLAVMTQSRGAIWSLVITLVLMFVVSPARLRTLFYLLVPALLMAYEFPSLNRYWLEGPEAVGGGLAARTLVVASITAAFIGMILALLERWIKVSRRMKAIFGSIVLLCALGGLVYGSIALTRDVGGPFKWVSQTWREFTGESSQQSTAETTTRFAMVTSSGRVDIWKVAWRGFEESPALGVGADNFVFQYDRLRTIELVKPRHAHSFELQVLGETGLVGAIFAFGGILLALGGLLWPRCTSGWRGARETWLRRRRDSDPARPSGASIRWCNPRWGNNSEVYGWETALLVGAAYWLVHASVDWLWQMAGVSIPALLFVAAGAAHIDARAGLLWPRLGRWLRMRAPTGPAVLAPSRETDTQVEDEREDTTVDAGSFLMMARRADHYEARSRRRERRAIRKRRSLELLQPPGLSSHVFRALVVTLSLVVIISAALPYLSIQYQRSAVALAKTDGARAVDRAGAARWLQPTDPGPYLTQASIYMSAASTTAASNTPDRAGAVIDNLALGLERLTEAIAQEPADWSLRYRAGVSALNLLIARDFIAGLSPDLEHAALASLVPGLEDWSALAGVDGALPGPGLGTGSLAATPETRHVSAHYRSLSKTDLGELALEFLDAARERNPLASQTHEAMKIVRQIQSN